MRITGYLVEQWEAGIKLSASNSNMVRQKEVIHSPNLWYWIVVANEVIAFFESKIVEHKIIDFL